MRLRLLLPVLVVTLGCTLAAQDNDLLPDKPAHNPSTPTITFQFEFSGANPSHYALAVDSTGRAAYTSSSPQDTNSSFTNSGQQPAAGDLYATKFTLSSGTTQQIFDLAKRLNYFDGKFDYTKTRVANMGAKTLVYGDPTRHFETTFNYSQNPDAMMLAHLFQNLSSTLEFGLRLDHDMRHQKLALEDDLKQLQDAAGHDSASEIGLLKPMLQKIANDASILHIARRRAQELLASLSQ